MRALWITGFPAFVGAPHNPSEAILDRLPRQLAGCSVRTRILPVDGQAIGPALEAIWSEAPLALIHTGVAIDRDQLSFETTAHNHLDYRVPDNAQALRQGPIDAGGPQALGSRLPEAAIVRAWHQAQVPFAVSRSAGRFLCNQTMYLSLAGLPASIPTGFLHLPPDERLGAALARPGLPLSLLVEAVEVAALAVAERRPELR